MRAILFLVFLLSIGNSNAEVSVRFVSNINRLPSQVMVSEVLQFTEMNPVGKRLWPKQLQGWVSKDTVIGTLNLGREIVWEGPSKAWIKICEPLKNTKLETKIKKMVVDKLRENKLVATIENVSGISFGGCLDKEKISTYSFRVELIGPKQASILISHQDRPGKTKTLTGHMSFSARVQGYVLLDAAFKERDYNSSIVKKIILPWTGNEAKSLPGELFRFKRKLNVGDIVHNYDLRVSNLVNAGDKIKVVVKHAGIEIEAIGRAMYGGALGQTVAVRVKGATTTCDGIVVGKGKVYVDII